MSRPALPFLALLRRHLPDWATGLAGRGLQLHHLGSLAALCREEPVFAETAWQVASWRWQLFPWDQQTRDLCAALSALARHPSLPEWTRQSTPLSTAHINGLRAIAANDAATVRHLWKQADPDNTHPIFFGEMFFFGLQHGDERLTTEILRQAQSSVPPSVFAHAQALHAFCHASENALSVIDRLPNRFSRLRDYLRAETLRRQGHPAGIPALLDLWRAMPWHVNLTLKLHTLLAPMPSPVHIDQSTAVCIYSWNNADLLDRTLGSLAQSTLGGAGIVLLDNGSTDHTPDVTERATRLFGKRLRALRLPVNIGAPGARNWLLHHPELTGTEHVAFLDDDVLLPPSWLEQLLAVATLHPRAHAVGCRIMDRPPRPSLQTADVNLLEFDSDHNFQIANTGGGEMTLGLHEYVRPSLSVTGCCHLLRRSLAVTLGGFDLRFSPSQFDDFDLDLRGALAGNHAVYCGHVAVRHCQRSSLGQADNEAKQGHIEGNTLKLNTKYSPEDKAELLRVNRELLWDDLLTKTRDLENA